VPKKPNLHTNSLNKLLLCIKAKKCIFFVRLKTGEDKRYFLAKMHVKFFKRPHELQPKDIFGKITNLFCIYFFYSTYFLSACQQNGKFTICNTITYLHNLWSQDNHCHYHLRCPAGYQTLDITLAVVLDISCCCYRLYERSFSYYAPNKHQK
jgi:hypothetical protein